MPAARCLLCAVLCMQHELSAREGVVKEQAARIEAQGKMLAEAERKMKAYEALYAGECVACWRTSCNCCRRLQLCCCSVRLTPPLTPLLLLLLSYTHHCLFRGDRAPISAGYGPGCCARRPAHGWHPRPSRSRWSRRRSRWPWSWRPFYGRYGRHAWRLQRLNDHGTLHLHAALH